VELPSIINFAQFALIHHARKCLKFKSVFWGFQYYYDLSKRQNFVYLDRRYLIDSGAIAPSSSLSFSRISITTGLPWLVVVRSSTATGGRRFWSERRTSSMTTRLSTSPKPNEIEVERSFCTWRQI
jgi:hypothetical protein